MNENVKKKGRGMLIAGNWKMHLNRMDALALCAALDKAKLPMGVQQVIAPSFTLLPVVAAEFPALTFAGQDCHAHPHGAHTGDVSAAMVKDAGADWVIIGHSERRHDHDEPDSLVAAKVAAALAVGLRPILCVGETLEQRDAGHAESTVKAQLAAAWQPGVTVLAYEPVWAIGTGRTASSGDIAGMHAVIRQNTALQTQILYGGSVKPSNAAEILATQGVDGVLVGGASLQAEDFLAILATAGDIASATSFAAQSAEG
jgi:triosephosphate isomerase